jgi:DNA-binding protein H-NS
VRVIIPAQWRGEFKDAGVPVAIFGAFQGALYLDDPMTKTYAQIVKQIAALQEEAELARRKEVDGVIARIREAITVYNLSAADLGFGGKPQAAAGKTQAVAKRSARKSAGRAGRGAGVVKYSNGNGGTWGGLGKRPQWLRDALAGGKTLEEFAVK